MVQSPLCQLGGVIRSLVLHQKAISFPVIKGYTWYFRKFKYRSLFMGFFSGKNTRFVYWVPVMPPHSKTKSLRRKGISNVLSSIPISPTHFQPSWLLASVEVALIKNEHFVPLCYGPALMSFCKLQTWKFVTFSSPDFCLAIFLTIPYLWAPGPLLDLR